MRRWANMGLGLLALLATGIARLLQGPFAASLLAAELGHWVDVLAGLAEALPHVMHEHALAAGAIAAQRVARAGTGAAHSLGAAVLRLAIPLLARCLISARAVAPSLRVAHPARWRLARGCTRCLHGRCTSLPYRCSVGGTLV